MKFLDINNIYINLDNVVSVKFEGNRVIFNYNYEISLDEMHVSPDYTYVEVPSTLDRKVLTETLESYNFITFKDSDNSNTYVNLENVSSIKEYTKNNKKRLIFNLNVGSSIRNQTIITANAVYYDFDTDEDFSAATIYLSSILGGL